MEKSKSLYFFTIRKYGSCVPFGFHMGSLFDDRLFSIEEHGSPDDAFRDLAVHIFLSSCTILFVQYQLWITEIRSSETVFFDEFFVTTEIISTHADELDIFFFQLIDEVAKFFGFDGTSRSVVFRIKVQEGIWCTGEKLFERNIFVREISVDEGEHREKNVERWRVENLRV